jgi:dethiobiotin synthetase
MKKGLFVTATSTEIGKTIISGMICYKLAENNFNTAYFKPVQSGLIADENDNKISGDCRFVKNVLACNTEFETYTSYMLNKPASPHFSALMENVTIDLKKIKADYESISADKDYIIVEGAGGLFVPLDENGKMMADIPRFLKINTILLGNAGLGAINQIGLSYNYALSKKLKISAIILISAEKTLTEIEAENVRILKKLFKTERIFIIPKTVGVDTENNKTGNIFETIKLFPDKDEIISWIHE